MRLVAWLVLGAIAMADGGEGVAQAAVGIGTATLVSERALRRRCRSCGSLEQELALDLGPSPLSQSFLRPDQLDAMEPFHPLRVSVCRECYLMQLPESASPAEIFSDNYAYFSSYSDTWLDHVRRYAERMIIDHGLRRKSLVIELASNDGYLLQFFKARGIRVLGVEPAGNVAAASVDRGIPTVVEFFGSELADRLVSEGHRADLLVGNNVLAHVPNLNDFVAGMARVLAPNGLLTMEFPHVLELLQGNAFDTIYHEHYSYFSLRSAQRVFEEHGLTVVDVEELETHGGSLRVHVRLANSRPTIRPAVRRLLAKESAAGLDRMEPYLEFGERVEALKRDVLEFLIGLRREGRTVAGYGAPAKANTLLNYCGIRTDLLPWTTDRSPHKQGLYTPGTHIPIHHPDRIAELRPDYIWILPWNLKDEVMSQLAYARDWGAKFVVTVPELRVA